MIRFVCRKARRVHAVSQELVNVLESYGIETDRIECFPVGVNLRRFAVHRRTADESDAMHIVCTRRQEEVYANHVFIEALAWLRDRGLRFQATLAGGGPLLQQRESQIRSLSLEQHVSPLGQVSHERISRILATSDIYVSASTSDGTSSSLLEALACGLFPVVTRIPANIPWVEDGVTGLFFEPGDVLCLGRALERALRDPDLRRVAAKKNRELVERKADQEPNMRRMLELLTDAAREVGV